MDPISQASINNAKHQKNWLDMDAIRAEYERLAGIDPLRFDTEDLWRSGGGPGEVQVNALLGGQPVGGAMYAPVSGRDALAVAQRLFPGSPDLPSEQFFYSEGSRIPELKRMGIYSALVDWANRNVGKIVPSYQLSADSTGFWENRVGGKGTFESHPAEWAYYWQKNGEGVPPYKQDPAYRYAAIPAKPLQTYVKWHNEDRTEGLPPQDFSHDPRAVVRKIFAGSQRPYEADPVLLRISTEDYNRRIAPAPGNDVPIQSAEVNRAGRWMPAEDFVGSGIRGAMNWLPQLVDAVKEYRAGTLGDHMHQWGHNLNVLTNPMNYVNMLDDVVHGKGMLGPRNNATWQQSWNDPFGTKQ